MKRILSLPIHLIITLLLVGFISACEKLPRGPYLQNVTTSSIVVRWRSDSALATVVEYGLSADNLNLVAQLNDSTKEHEIKLSELQADATYFYRIIGKDGLPSATHSFKTAPLQGDRGPIRVWLVGDSGTADSNAAAVRDAFYDFNNGSKQTDLWIMLGDNAYTFGNDAEYQKAVFQMYPETLATTPLFSTIGNHEVLTGRGSPYFDIFTLPTEGEGGGIASGTEAYYSFDYGNVHFVCLDSEIASRAVNGAMYNWLISDLQANTQDWTVVFFHQPPYSKGSHNSDSGTETHIKQMRETFVPVFDEYGVDLVFSGHSHSYERSHLLQGHTGTSTTITPEMVVDAGGGREDENGAFIKLYNQTQNGVVYTVAGSSGKTSGGDLNHPAHFISLRELGSVVLDIEGDRVDAHFINPANGQMDHYTVVKN